MHNHPRSEFILPDFSLVLPLLIVFATLFFLIKYYKRRSFRESASNAAATKPSTGLYLLSGSAMTKKNLVFLAVIFLLLLHHSPVMTAFAYHHQAESLTGDHPCCMPQMSEATEPFTISVTEGIVALIKEPVPQPFVPFIYSPYNPRSPPASS